MSYPEYILTDTIVGIHQAPERRLLWIQSVRMSAAQRKQAYALVFDKFLPRSHYAFFIPENSFYP